MEISVGFADYNGALLMLKQLDRQLAAYTRAVETVRVSITRIAKQVEQPCQLRPAIKAAASCNKKLRHALDLIGFEDDPQAHQRGNELGKGPAREVRHGRHQRRDQRQEVV